jgi:hypothetical protein
MNLKKKYNKLFAGKPKSNDKMLTEGSVFLGIGNSGRRINEDESMESGMDYTTFIESLETAAMDLEQVLQEIDNQLQDDMAMSYEAKQARVTINRYASAVMKNLQGIEKTLQGL